MISKYNHKELNWVDLESPKEEEILHIIEQYSIPSDIKNKIISRNTDDNININYDFIYVSISSKLIFVVNDDFVLTIHDKPIEAFNQFSKEMELDVVGEGKIDSHKLLFAYLLKNLYIDSERKLILNNNKINELEKQIRQNIKKGRIFIVLIILLVVSLIISLIWR